MIQRKVAALQSAVNRRRFSAFTASGPTTMMDRGHSFVTRSLSSLRRYNSLQHHSFTSVYKQVLNWRLSVLQISDVLDKMDDDWGSLACPSSDSHTFWKHEWTKHGTCSGLGQHGYFEAAIDLYIKHDITGALANAGEHSSHK